MADLSAPDDRLYWVDQGRVVEHIWLKKKNGNYRIGLTEPGLRIIGEVVSLAPMRKGASVARGEALFTVESSKWVGPVSAPFDARVAGVNQALADNPAELNDSPYQGWIVEITPQGDDAAQSPLAGGPDGAALYLSAASKDLEED